MKIITSFLALLILISIVIIVALQKDDPLLPEIRPFMDLTKADTESEAYLFLMGVSSDSNEVEFGREIYKQFLAERENTSKLTLADYQVNYPKDAVHFCREWKENCYKNILKLAAENVDLARKYSTYPQKFARFIQLDDYRTMTRPSIFEPYPNFQFIVIASRVFVIDSLKTFYSGSVRHSIANLASHLSDLK